MKKINSNEITGTVLNIERCSLYDGPGIRTSVFLKGCPLSCMWCHNPESQASKPELAYFIQACTGCMACESSCPVGAHQFISGAHELNRKLCTGCGQCVNVCPNGSLKLYGSSMSVHEVMEIVCKDRNYYRDDGGLTVTGGEPFAQPIFLQALLENAKAESIHICVETCGCVSSDKLLQISPLIDLFLFDFKLTSSSLHKCYTGVDNTLILQNLDLLIEHDKKVVLRCPVIPGVNDDAEHFKSIAALEKRLVGVEIMPYHDLGKEKAAAIGIKNQLGIPAADAETKDYWRQLLTDCGCSEAIINSF